ncbi:hypothetical protein FRB97_006831 [Tulasnella sp. 331]|nr:hypothetical protein FRB97_006831 [Tulasnella sp. 331]KAG8885196.1 hypothetical protein FRB98_001924 [Tulasnella sp. 332]
MDADIPTAEEDDIVLENIEPHVMRITSHQKERVFIAFALKFLQDNPSRPLVLHTRKSEILPIAKAAASKKDTGTAESDASRLGKLGRQCTHLTPRLISIVEIIKRELPKTLRNASTGANGDRDAGKLHQYNQVLCLEDEEEEAPVDQEDTTESRLQMAVNGENHLKVKRTPYMKITLSRAPVPALEVSKATYQAPIWWKPNKAQKAREKKRAKKKAAGAEEKEDEEMQPEAPVEAANATKEPLKGVIGTVEL